MTCGRRRSNAASAAAPTPRSGSRAQVALDLRSARAYLDAVLAPLLQVLPSAALYHRALDIQERYRFGFYDSLIVAAALAAGCRRLLSEDMQDGQRIEGLTIRNPFGQ